MVKLDEVTPAISRPSASHQRFGASAISTKSAARPKAESRITGRRPYWSDSEPMTGEATNCITAQSATNTPLIQPACGVGAGELLDQRRQHRDDDAHRHDVEHRDDEDEGKRRIAARAC